MKKKSTWLVLCVAVCLNMAAPAFAQIIPPDDFFGELPNAGNVLQDYQKKDYSKIQTEKAPPPPEPLNYDLIPLEDQVVAGSQRLDVYIDTIQVKGITLLETQAVDEVVQSYQGRRLEFTDLEQLAQRLTDRYRQQGFVTSRVYIPSQRISDGVVTFQALEGRIGKILYNEGRWIKPFAIAHRIDAEEGDFLNIKDISHNLKLINEHPDMKVKTSLTAGEDPGETDLTFNIEDQLPLHASFSYDNLGRKFIGFRRIGITATNNNLLGLGDRLTTNITGSVRSKGIVAHYEADVWKYGTILGMDFAKSNLRLGDDFKPLRISGSALVYSPFINQRIYQGKNWNATAGIAFDIKKLANNIFDEPFTQDRIRLLRPNITINEYDRWGSTMLQSEVGIGICMFNCSTGKELGSARNPALPQASRLNAGSRFVRWNGTAVRLQKLPYNSFGIFKLMSQISPEMLVSSEQMQVGGAFTVRGYREGRYIGDSGFVASSELHFPLYFVPDSWHIPFTHYSLRQNVQMVAFSEFGAININNAGAGTEASEYLMGAGFGVRAKLTRLLTGRFDVAWPLLKAPPDTARPRVHFGILSTLL